MRKLSRLALNDEGFAFDPTTGDSYVLNETALFLVKALREGKTAPELAAAMAEEFEVAEADAERDANDLVQRLASLGLL